MKKSMFLSLMFVLLFSSFSYAAGLTFVSLTFSSTDKRQIAELVYTWEAAANGVFPTESLPAGITSQLKWYYLDMMLVDPLTPAPTALYTIAIRDQYTVDILGGNGAGLSATDGEQILPKVGGSEGDRLITTELQVEISGNSVNAASGKIVLIFIKGEQ